MTAAQVSSNYKKIMSGFKRFNKSLLHNSNAAQLLFTSKSKYINKNYAMIALLLNYKCQFLPYNLKKKKIPFLMHHSLIEGENNKLQTNVSKYFA